MNQPAATYEGGSKRGFVPQLPPKKVFVAPVAGVPSASAPRHQSRVPSSGNVQQKQRGIMVTIIHQENKYPDVEIEHGMPVSIVIRTALQHIFKGQAVPGMEDEMVLRISDSDKILTEEMMRKKLFEGITLKLVKSPSKIFNAALEIVKDLDKGIELARHLPSLEAERQLSKEEVAEILKPLRKAVFQLSRAIKDKEFPESFIPETVQKVQHIIKTQHGNILAYALAGLQNLLEAELCAWENFGAEFIGVLVSFIVRESLVNICRPATAIVIKLIHSDRSQTTSSTYGFDVVNNAINALPNFLPTLVQRLDATEYSLQLNSMHLINCLYKAAIDMKKSSFLRKLEGLRVRSSAVKLMLSQPNEELGKQLNEFQRLVILEGHRDKREHIGGTEHEFWLREIWELSGVVDHRDGIKWRSIGFNTENPKRELRDIGRFGLQQLHNFVKVYREYYRRFFVELSNRPENRRCPFARAFIEVIEILCDYWDISTGYTTTTSYQLLLLRFEESVNITLKTFIRLWTEMEAYNNNDDIVRVSSLVGSQFRWSVKNCEGDTSKFESAMLNTPFAMVRERQLKELEIEDEIVTKNVVRQVRERLYRESFEFIKQQRVGCLVAGAWFPMAKEKGRVKNLWRYYRMAPNKRWLHYKEYSEKLAIKPVLDDLVEREIASGYSSPVFSNKKLGENVALCFSLLSADTESAPLADFICETALQYAEWIDGFNMLLDRSITEKNTADYIQQLTDIGLKLCLLDLTGERLDFLNQAPEIPELPSEGRFYYEETHIIPAPVVGAAVFEEVDHIREWLSSDILISNGRLSGLQNGISASSLAGISAQNFNNVGLTRSVSTSETQREKSKSSKLFQ